MFIYINSSLMHKIVLQKFLLNTFANFVTFLCEGCLQLDTIFCFFILEFVFLEIQSGGTINCGKCKHGVSLVLVC